LLWWAVAYDGTTDIHFCEKGVKTGARVYIETVLEPIVKPLSNTLFKNKHWIFQQDSAPAHKAKITQTWLEQNLPEFIASTDWPSGSPDLNPLDYSLWSKLEEIVCRKRHSNISSLKEALIEAVDNFPLEIVRAAIDDYPRRLKECVKAKGGHFE